MFRQRVQIERNSFDVVKGESKERAAPRSIVSNDQTRVTE